MLMDPDPHTRTRTRRRSACNRHPNQPVIGLCALCLRDRLAGLDSSTDQLQVQSQRETIVSFPLSRRTRARAARAGGSSLPELRRSKSIAVDKCEISNDLSDLSSDPRRKSCDVRFSDRRNRLTDLFDVDDSETVGNEAVTVESKNLGFTRITEPVVEIDEVYDDCSEIRVSDDLIVRNEVEIDDDGDIEEEEEEEDLRPMKEHIEMELQNRKRNFWEAASVFSQKLKKWRQKHKEKKQSDSNRLTFNQFNDFRIQSDVADFKLGRRSCDVAPRVSIDAHRMSVEDPRCSFDEHRASWDGYMIARTIPRLTPMLPIVDDMIFPPVNKMIAVKEDGSSSGASAKSNSDSSSSNTGSSSSSLKSSSSKTAGLDGSYMKSVSFKNDVIGQETKLVITERELKDWHLSSVNNCNLESASNAPVSTRRTVKNGWKKVSSLWSHKHKLSDKKNDGCIHENTLSLNQNNEIKIASGNSSSKLARNGTCVGSRNISETHPNGQNNEINGVGTVIPSGKLVRNSSCVGSRNRTESHPSGLEGCRHSVSAIESGLMRLHFSAFGKSRKKLAPTMGADG